jgi:hypothetical protein
MRGGTGRRERVSKHVLGLEGRRVKAEGGVISPVSSEYGLTLSMHVRV